MNPLSLPKIYLLRKKSEYDNVYLRGKRVHGENFSLILLPNNQEHNRLGISIHGQLKGAAKRNLQEKSSRSRELPSMDIVITVRKGFNLEKPADVAVAIRSLLDRSSSSFL
jgi:ribonuclease P protein component